MALQIQIAHAQRDPQRASQRVDEYWSLAFMEAFRSSSHVAPGLADDLPSVARRQLRATLAWRMLAVGAPRPEGLDAQVEWLQRALAGEDVLAGTAPDTPISYDSSEAIPPAQPGQGQDSQRTTAYLGGDHRVWSKDPRADMAICLLEASARLHPQERGLLEEGLASRDRDVRATAERLSRRRGDPGRGTL